MAQEIKVGSIVNFRMPHPNWTKEPPVRPAIVVQVWDGETPPRLNLQVFVDGTNDGAQFANTGTYWATSVSYQDNAQAEPNTWHFPAS